MKLLGFFSFFLSGDTWFRLQVKSLQEFFSWNPFCIKAVKLYLQFVPHSSVISVKRYEAVTVV